MITYVGFATSGERGTTSSNEIKNNCTIIMKKKSKYECTGIGTIDDMDSYAYVRTHTHTSSLPLFFLSGYLFIYFVFYILGYLFITYTKLLCKKALYYIK